MASGSMEESAATSRSWMAMWAGNRAHSGTLLLVLLSACASAPALACTGQHNRGADIHLTIDGWDDVEQDKVISSWLWAGNAGFLTGCTAGELIPFDLTSALPGRALLPRGGHIPWWRGGRAGGDHRHLPIARTQSRKGEVTA
ncbi:TPA: hypothetical protein ACKP5X_003659 [Stenotrophomonas maltophilia]|nr:hypothetical protein [Stenotrophomonas maltophilia]